MALAEGLQNTRPPKFRGSATDLARADIVSEEKPNGSRIFYLTVRQDYLIVNNWGLFLNMRYPEVWMSQEDIEYYFPKKWTFNTNKKIPYKKIDKYEDEE